MIVISLISCPTERITRGNYNIFKGFKFMTFKLIVMCTCFWILKFSKSLSLFNYSLSIFFKKNKLLSFFN